MRLTKILIILSSLVVGFTSGTVSFAAQRDTQADLPQRTVSYRQLSVTERSNCCSATTPSDGAEHQREPRAQYFGVRIIQSFPYIRSSYVYHL